MASLYSLQGYLAPKKTIHARYGERHLCIVTPTHNSPAQIGSPPARPQGERSFAAIRKDTGLYRGSRLRKGEVFAYVGLSQNLKGLTETFPSCRAARLPPPPWLGVRCSQNAQRRVGGTCGERKWIPSTLDGIYFR